MDNIKTLGEALPEEINRVQELIALYKTFPGGKFAAALMQMDIDAAHKAMMEGNLAEMIAIHEELKAWKE